MTKNISSLISKKNLQGLKPITKNDNEKRLKKIGGFQHLTILELLNDSNYRRAISVARREYKKKHRKNLSWILSVSKQVVGGVNYQIIFQNRNK